MLVYKEEDLDIEPIVESVTIRLKGGRVIELPTRFKEDKRFEEFLKIPNLQLYALVVLSDGINVIASNKGTISPYVLLTLAEHFRAIAKQAQTHQESSIGYDAKKDSIPYKFQTPIVDDSNES